MNVKHTHTHTHKFVANYSTTCKQNHLFFTCFLTAPFFLPVVFFLPAVFFLPFIFFFVPVLALAPPFFLPVFFFFLVFPAAAAPALRFLAAPPALAPAPPSSGWLSTGSLLRNLGS